MVGLTFTDAEFGVMKDRATRAYKDFDMEQPLQHVVYGASMSLNTPRWHNDDKIAAIADVTADQLRAFLRDSLWAQAHTVMLVHGSVTKEEAAAIADGVTQPVASAPGAGVLVPSQHIFTRVSKLPGTLYLPTATGATGTGGATGKGAAVHWEWRYGQAARNPEEPNCAMSYLLQVGPATSGPAAGVGARFAVLTHLLAEPYFDTLRTKQALGYIVNAGGVRENGVSYMRFIVQSNKVPAAAELIKRTDAFLEAYAGTLAEMPDDKFAANVKAVLNDVNQQDKNLYEEARNTWTPIAVDATLDFDAAAHVTAALKALTKASLVDFMRDYVLPGGKYRRAFISLMEASPTATHGTGGADVEEEAEEGSEGEESGGEEAPATAPAAAETAAKEATTAATADAAPGTTLTSPSSTASAAAGAPAPTGGSGLASEDALAPVLSKAASTSSTTTISTVPSAASGTVVEVSAQQALAILSSLRLLEYLHVPADGGVVPAGEATEAVLAVFKAHGVDLAHHLARATAAGTGIIRLACRVENYDHVRSVLPRYASAAAAAMPAFRAAAGAASKASA